MRRGSRLLGGCGQRHLQMVLTAVLMGRGGSEVTEDAEEQHSELGCGAGHDHEECAGQQAVEANAAMQLVIESHHDLNTSLPNKDWQFVHGGYFERLSRS